MAARAGRFRLETLLGEDASGELHRAVDVESGAIAIVRITRAESGSARRDRLLRETKKAAQVKHEGLALVLEVGQTETGDMFVAVESIEGERLSDRLRARAPLAEREAASIASQIARALATAHDAGVVHRDLRPSLIVLSGEGEGTRAKIEGLVGGIAPRAHDPANAEVAYEAPEQRRGEPAGRRADVYSIGAMLYAMLTGRPPEPGAAATTDELGALGDVVKRCLADDPRDRFLDTVALGAALRIATASDHPPRASSSPPSSRRLSAPAPAPAPARTSTPAPSPVSERPPPSTASPSQRPSARVPSVRPPSPDSSSAIRAPAAPPQRPLGRPLTARPPWKEALLDLGDGPLPRVLVTLAVVFVIVRLVASGFVPYVAAVVAGVVAYATWRRSRTSGDR